MRQALSDADFVIDTALARASTGASDAPAPPSDMAIVAVKVRFTLLCMCSMLHAELHSLCTWLASLCQQVAVTVPDTLTVLTCVREYCTLC
jgi:hypothetical protein